MRYDSPGAGPLPCLAELNTDRKATTLKGHDSRIASTVQFDIDTMVVIQ
jgi:hypothetical protein